MSPKRVAEVSDAPQNCQSCGTPFIGKYCYQCGEKKPSDTDFSLYHFVEQSVDTITHFDGKFFRSVKYLVAKPGKLTSELLAGRRVSLMKPVQLYLIIALAFFLLFKDWDIFYNKLQFIIMDTVEGSTELVPRQNLKGLGNFFREHAEENAKAHKMSLAQYVQYLDNKMGDYSKAFTLLMVPFLGLGIWLLYFNKHRRYVPHLVHALHLFTFYLLLATLWLEIYSLAIHPFLDKFYGSIAFIPMNLLFMLYSYLSFRRVYGSEPIPTLLKMLGFTIVCVIVFFFYRIAVTFIALQLG